MERRTGAPLLHTRGKDTHTRGKEVYFRLAYSLQGHAYRYRYWRKGVFVGIEEEEAEVACASVLVKQKVSRKLAISDLRSIR